MRACEPFDTCRLEPMSILILGCRRRSACVQPLETVTSSFCVVLLILVLILFKYLLLIPGIVLTYVLLEYRKYRSLGTHPSTDFLSRPDCSTTKRVSMPKRAIFERSRRELSLDVSVGAHILLVVEQSSLENQSNDRGGVPRLLPGNS